jgi:hypothetical protein
MLSCCLRVSVILSLRRIRDSDSDADHEKLDRSFGRPALREASLRAQRTGTSLRMTGTSWRETLTAQGSWL